MTKGLPIRLSSSPRLPAFTPRSSQALADRIHALKHARKISGYRQFVKESGVSFGKIRSDKGYEQRLSRWLNDPYDEFDLLGYDNYIKLLQFVLKKYPSFEDQIQTPILQLLQNPIYHSMAPILNCQDRGDARKTLIDNLQGNYVIYRPSMRRGGYGYVGFMEINFDAISDSFTTRELYEINYEDGSNEYWDVKGSMFPINKNTHMITSVDQVDNSIQIKYINAVGFNIERVTYFTGWVSDTDRNIYYTAPIYCLRVNDFNQLKLDFMPIAEMPKAVRTWFADSPHADLKKASANIWTEK